MKKYLGIPVGLAFFGFFVLAYLALASDWHRHKRAPDQPIDFSHKIHVGMVGLECLFCHETADKSTFAGIPTVEKCMSCHKNVATNRPEIQKLAAYWNAQTPMEWNRVHRIRVRNHVYFSHKRHVKANIDCAACHGEVEYMDKIRQISSLEMGWCVQCHRQKEAPTDCLTCHR
ncbi:MAG: cytochrome c3 family protein [Candidatus Latescibacterota bacterium]|nr:MAG: cytochrome c3 family protein [Candidatus Latescibacterota bacterium]